MKGSNVKYRLFIFLSVLILIVANFILEAIKKDALANNRQKLLSGEFDNVQDHNILESLSDGYFLAIVAVGLAGIIGISYFGKKAQLSKKEETTDSIVNEKKKSRCPKCGATVPANANFCHSCYQSI
ncbi:hypothetical protein FACS189438_1720 [Bacteroidia bacterium]|nr:hypothetical protein FACS189438_1720 [Bacteroidia bacterium]